MEIKIYLFLLVAISVIALIYLALGSVNQVDPQIDIVNNVSQYKGINSNDILNGVSKTKCENCSGEGVIECPTCKGSGELVKSIDCKNCGSPGKIYKNQDIIDCPYCDDGKIVETTICNVCHGSGQIKCPVCNGKGII